MSRASTGRCLAAMIVCIALAACSSQTSTGAPDDGATVRRRDALGGPPTPHSEKPTAQPRVDGPSTTADADVDSDCPRYHRALAGAVGRSTRSAGGSDYVAAAGQLWSGAPASCRDGAWHAAAARLLRLGAGKLAATGGPTLTAAENALQRGLEAPAHRELLALVAFLAPLGSGPALPARACELAGDAPPVAGPAYESDDRARYVCGHAALARAEWREAMRQLDSITMKTHYPDLPLRRAQARVCAGRSRGVKSLLRKARRLDSSRAAMLGASEAEQVLLREQATVAAIRALGCADR